MQTYLNFDRALWHGMTLVDVFLHQSALQQSPIDVHGCQNWCPDDGQYVKSVKGYITLPVIGQSRLLVVGGGRGRGRVGKLESRDADDKAEQ